MWVLVMRVLLLNFRAVFMGAAAAAGVFAVDLATPTLLNPATAD
jgi:predicted branched-subunit amino acid permease